jgi:hypothetical protein
MFIKQYNGISMCKRMLKDIFGDVGALCVNRTEGCINIKTCGT